jgi:methionine-rich copper-binding protein CopC
MKNPARLFPHLQKITFVTIALLMWFGATHSAFAHAQLIKSNPPAKAELKQAPTRIDLWFNELLEEGFNSIEVIPAAELSDKRHSNLTAGPAKVDPKDKTHLSVELSSLKPGKYVVQFRVLSRDGHSAPGRLMFEILEEKK